MATLVSGLIVSGEAPRPSAVASSTPPQPVLRRPWGWVGCPPFLFCRRSTVDASPPVHNYIFSYSTTTNNNSLLASSGSPSSLLFWQHPGPSTGWWWCCCWCRRCFGPTEMFAKAIHTKSCSLKHVHVSKHLYNYPRFNKLMQHSRLLPWFSSSSIPMCMTRTLPLFSSLLSSRSLYTFHHGSNRRQWGVAFTSGHFFCSYIYFSHTFFFI